MASCLAESLLANVRPAIANQPQPPFRWGGRLEAAALLWARIRARRVRPAW